MGTTTVPPDDRPESRPSPAQQQRPAHVRAQRYELEVQSGPAVEIAAPAPATAEAAGTEPREEVVIVAYHGMGEHLPMSAMQDALVLLKEVLGLKLQSFRPHSFVVEGQHYTQVVAETEEARYRISEAYYSPYFKGLANVGDVFAFLAGAGLRAIRGARRLRRTFCGEVYEFKPARGTTGALFLALAVLVSMLGLNAFFAASAAQTVLGGGAMPATFSVATWGMGLVVTLGLLLGMLMGITRRFPNGAWAGVTYAMFVGVCLSLPAVALAVAMAHWEATAGWLAWVPPVSSGWFWAAGIVFALGSLGVRIFFDGYVGDVTAYVGGYGSSKFFQARRSVAARMDRVMNATTRGGCDHLIVLAHSLGTVVAYDALNRFLLPQGAPGGVAPTIENHSAQVKRITFITYGSPLDKIAYLFRSESGSRDDLRNDFIASRQPLTCRGSLHCPVEWINVYAKHDIVAGSLDYFDNGKSYRVENILDEHNRVPLSSHSDYRFHAGLKEAMRRAVLGVKP